LRAWMRDIILPRKQRRNDFIRSLRSEKDSIAARDRRILEFPLSMSPNAIAKILKTEAGTVQKPLFILRKVVECRGGKTQLLGAST
jgi:hypothetical protein